MPSAVQHYPDRTGGHDVRPERLRCRHCQQRPVTRHALFGDGAALWRRDRQCHRAAVAGRFFPDLGGTAISAAPSDTAAAAAEWFQTIELTGFTGIDELRFASLGEVGSDPPDLLDNGFLPEFAIDALRIVPADASTEVVEPARRLLLAALGCLFVCVGGRSAASGSGQRTQ